MAESRARPGIGTRSIDWVPDGERHGKLWHRGPLWFLGNFQYFTIAVRRLRRSATRPAARAVLGLPRMIQPRAQFGYRGVVVLLAATIFTYVGFDVADQVLLSQGLNGIFGWDPTLVAAGSAVVAVPLAV